MKKLKTILLMLAMSLILVCPLATTSAESYDIFYPNGISDYVDLNNIKNFAVDDSKIFYTKDNKDIFCYDKSDKSTTKLASDVNVKNLEIAGEYLFVFSTTGRTTAFDIESLASVTFANAPSGFSSINVSYVNNKYYFGYIWATSTANRFSIKSYSTLSGTATEIKADETFDSDVLGSKIVLSDNLAIIKPTTGEKIYLFKDYQNASSSSDLVTLKSSLDKQYHEINGFNSTTKVVDVAVLNFADSSYTNCIFISYEGALKTQVCKFNGNALSYESENTIVSDKMATSNNTLYIYDNDSANISTCNYNVKNNSFTLSQTILAGKGSEQGRFKDVSNLTYKSGTYYVTDSGNNRLQIIDNTEINVINNLNGQISEVVVDSDNNYYFVLYDGTSSKLYKNGNRLLRSFDDEIISIAINLDDTIYMITTNKIITFKSSSNITKTLTTTLDDSSKLRIMNNYTNKNLPISGVTGQSTYLISNNKSLYSIDPSTGNATKSVEFDYNILDFKINGALSNSPIFALLDNGDFVKVSLSDVSSKTTLSGFNDYTCFSMDYISGEIQLYNQSMSAIEIYSNSEFSGKHNLSHYNNSIYSAVSGFSELWQYTQIKPNALIYDYYNFLGNYKETTQLTNAIVLEVPVDKDSGQLGEFALIGYVNNRELKFGYVQTTDLQNGITPMALSTTTYKLRTTQKNVAVYKYPTIFSAKYDGEEKTFNINTVAQASIINTYGKYLLSIDNYNYYIIKIGNTYGYICSNDVIVDETTSKNIKTNATVKIFDGSDKIDVYLTEDDDSSILYRLSDGDKINVKDYNKNSKFTKITFIDSDQQEREGYILTTYVKLSGLSTAVITAIILLALDVVIAVVVIIFYHHYKKKQKEKSDIN